MTIQRFLSAMLIVAGSFSACFGDAAQAQESRTNTTTLERSTLVGDETTNTACGALEN
jgi:hypothetical protein